MKHSKTPSIKNLKQELYTESPYNLGSVNDSAFGTGVNYALENEVIVKAVNSHDALVEALTDAINWLKYLEASGYRLNKIESALKQAKGE